MKRMLASILALTMTLSSLNAAIAHRKSPAKHSVRAEIRPPVARVLLHKA